MVRSAKGVFFEFEDNIAVPPLTDDEKRWINRLQKVLAACPKRLALTTIGDPSLQVVDITEQGIDSIGDGVGVRNGVVVALIDGGPNVHGLCG